MKVLAVTGYKSFELNIFKADDKRIDVIKYALRKHIVRFIEEGLEWVIVSGQIGVEMWAAEIVMELQEEYPIRLGFFPPFENQESRWPEPIQQVYQELMFGADFFEPIYKGDYKAPYQFRAKNMWFVDKSDGCLMLMDEEFPGSTRFFYEQAKKHASYLVFIIRPEDLEDAALELQMQDPAYWDNL
nr:DUF1273 domain-containing protein [Virgibacillus sp. LDC-1]